MKNLHKEKYTHILSNFWVSPLIIEKLVTRCFRISPRKSLKSRFLELSKRGKGEIIGEYGHRTKRRGHLRASVLKRKGSLSFERLTS